MDVANITTWTSPRFVKVGKHEGHRYIFFSTRFASVSVNQSILDKLTVFFSIALFRE